MNRATYAIVGTIVAIAVVAVVVVGFVLPNLMGVPEEVQWDLVMVDYGFERADFQPTMTVVAGQRIVLTVSNEGTQEHEFMLLEDKDMGMMMMNNMIQTILANENLTTDEQREAMYETMHHDMDMAMDDANGVSIEVEVEPDGSDTITFVIDEPGTYYFVCHNVGGTWPEIHQAEGMWGTLIVEPA